MTNRKTRRIERLYQSYVDGTRPPPRIPANQEEFTASIVYTLKHQQGDPDVDFARDSRGNIVGVRGIGMKTP